LQMTSRRVFRSKTVVIEACRLAKTERWSEATFDMKRRICQISLKWWQRNPRKRIFWAVIWSEMA
jgi:hypothetical protein